LGKSFLIVEPTQEDMLHEIYDRRIIVVRQISLHNISNIFLHYSAAVRLVSTLISVIACVFYALALVGQF
jgi:hypothetical protein